MRADEDGAKANWHGIRFVSLFFLADRKYSVP